MVVKKTRKGFAIFKKSSYTPEKKFKLKSSNNRLRVGSKFSKIFKSFYLFLILSVSFLFIGFLLYYAYKFVVNIRQRDTISTVENVYGFDIPSYPNSEFIFKNNLDDSVVAQFLSLGNSVYRLPKDTDINDVFEYYITELGNLGWTHQLSVPINSEERMYGEYFVKDTKGLRIYSRLNDIWYQSVSVIEASNGLEDQVKKETARKLLLLTTEKTELLPDYPWRLSFPTEYQTKYYNSSVSSFQGVRFQKIGSNVITYLEPVGYFGAMPLDDYLIKYLDIYNRKYKKKWVVTNSVLVQFNSNDAIRGTITDGKETSSIYSIHNTGNNLVYIITSFEDKEPFSEYIFNNLKPSSGS